MAGLIPKMIIMALHSPLDIDARFINIFTGWLISALPLITYHLCKRVRWNGLLFHDLDWF